MERAGNSPLFLMQLQESLKLFSAIAAAEAIILTVHDWVASKQYVTESTQPIAEDVKQILAIGIADQISTLIRYNCNNPDDTKFVPLLREKKLEYAQLTGREFMEAPCDRLSN